VIAVYLVPAAIKTARLTAGLAGSEWFEFDAALAPRMDLRFVPEGTPFPTRGTVSIRRGLDRAQSGERLADSFRFIAGATDDETGEPVPARFGVTLFMAEAAFDRLLARMHWGLPELVLFFDAASQVLVQRPGGGPEDLDFRANPQAWERIASATLTQRPPQA
jgi:hypothetical protein